MRWGLARWKSEAVTSGLGLFAWLEKPPRLESQRDLGAGRVKQREYEVVNFTKEGTHLLVISHVASGALLGPVVMTDAVDCVPQTTRAITSPQISSVHPQWREFTSPVHFSEPPPTFTLGRDLGPSLSPDCDGWGGAMLREMRRKVKYQPDLTSDRLTAEGRREICSAGGLGPRYSVVRPKQKTRPPAGYCDEYDLDDGEYDLQLPQHRRSRAPQAVCQMTGALPSDRTSRRLTEEISQDLGRQSEHPRPVDSYTYQQPGRRTYMHKCKYCPDLRWHCASPGQDPWAASGDKFRLRTGYPGTTIFAACPERHAGGLDFTTADIAFPGESPHVAWPQQLPPTNQHDTSPPPPVHCHLSGTVTAMAGLALVADTLNRLSKNFAEASARDLRSHFCRKLTEVRPRLCTATTSRTSSSSIISIPEQNSSVTVSPLQKSFCYTSQ
ncbi:hypothetical protein Bbelb_309010 [Branchiostoma belcheri]|nr:hypothetical protein Bbelb_309010 [Branchiostoma belcheri]